MTYLVLVWYLASGSLGAVPWEEFPTFAECEQVRQHVQNTVTEGRFLFLAGCLSAKDAHKFTGFELSLKHGDDDK